MATLASLGRHDDSSDEDNEESDEESGQTFYAGGSETSGQQILGPPKKKKGASEFVSDMFRRARAAGAEAVESGYGPGSSSGSSAAAFSGTAFRLGSEVSDSEMVPSSQVGPKKPIDYEIHFYHLLLLAASKTGSPARVHPQDVVQWL